MTARWRMAVASVVLVPALALAAFLLIARPPVDGFRPETWDPGDAVSYPPAITAAADVHPLTGPPINGPEDIVSDADGRLYTGDRDGVIWRFPAAGGDAERWAEVGGRPLGLAFAGDGRLLVANHGLGLQAVSPGGTVETLADEAAGAPILFANDLDVTTGGVVYLSDSSARYNTTTLGTGSSSYLLPDAIDGRASGRLIAHDLGTGRTEVVLDGVHFPNGVALTPGERTVWVAESNRYRVLEYDRATGATRTALTHLPGTPDNIDRTPDGRLAVAVYDRSGPLDTFVLPYEIGRQILIRLPADLFVNEEDPLAGGVVIARPDGTVTGHLTGITPAPTSVHAAGDRWYLGALLGQPIRWVNR